MQIKVTFDGLCADLWDKNVSGAACKALNWKTELLVIYTGILYLSNGYWLYNTCINFLKATNCFFEKEGGCLQLVSLTAEPNLPGMKYCSLAK